MIKWVQLQELIESSLKGVNVSYPSRAAKALIITWVVIGLLIAGVVGFYLGRKTASKNQDTTVDRQLQPGAQLPAQQGGGTNQESPPLPAGQGTQQKPQ